MSREFDELLSAYLDGEVSPEERAAVEQRLEQSPQLRETLDELSEVGDLIRRLPKPRAPLDLPERVVAAIATKPLASTAVPQKRNRLLGAWPLLAAGTVLAAGVAIVVVMPRGPKNVDNLASNSPRSGGVPVLAASPPMRGLNRDDADHDGVKLTDLSADGADRFDDASLSRSLTRYVNTLGRAPRQGEVMRTLRDNAGETQVLVFNVVDTRQIENKVRTIFINNSMNIVETETPIPQPAPATTALAGELVYYVEGPPQQVEKALEDIEAFAVPGGVYDLGPLASDPEPAARREFNFAEGAAAKPAGEPATILLKDKAEDRPATTPAPTAAPAPRYSVPLPASDFSQTPPTPAAPAAASARGGAEPVRTKAQLGDELSVKAGETAKTLESVPPKPGPEKPEVEKLATPAPAQVTNGYLGVSTQIDSNSAILEPLRNRAPGNAVGNAVQGNAILGNQLQRNSFGQNQSFFRSRNQRSAEEPQDRKLNESVRGTQEDLSESKAAGPKQQLQRRLPQQLQQQPGLTGRTVTDGTRNLDTASVANPQSVSSSDEDLVRALIILKAEPPKAAAPPAPAESAPKKAGD